MGRLRKFLRLDHGDRMLCLEALMWLGLAKLMILFVPFRRIAPRLGLTMHESPAEVSPADVEVGRSISWAVRAVARHVPLGFVCLPQAIAAKWMLRRRDLDTTLYLGVKNPGAEAFAAHAWLRLGDKILTGQRDSDSHTPLASFAGRSSR